jgi:hypothetical protein
MDKPKKLYHGSNSKINGPLKPVLKKDSPDHIHIRPAVFGTARIDIAALFMFPFDNIASVGFEQDIAYICIWGTPEEFIANDKGGFIYVLSSDTFEKIGKEYERQSFKTVMPIEIKEFSSVIDGIIICKAQVYFIDNNLLFDRIITDKNNRAPILKELISENQKKNVGIKIFK